MEPQRESMPRGEHRPPSLDGSSAVSVFVIWPNAPLFGAPLLFCFGVMVMKWTARTLQKTCSAAHVMKSGIFSPDDLSL